ncbi:transposase, partial [Mariprofundus erugo]
PDQSLLLPPSLSDWLPSGHLAYFINDTVDSLDLSAFHARYSGGGPRNQPFHPSMMVKILLYGYATGVFSSRKIAKKLHEDVAFRLLAAGNYPAHRTICDFRALHLKELSDL